MKRIFIAALTALLSFSTMAATLNPVQLLNPAGSTSGQAIVSTGASTAPAWANVTASGLTPVAANTVIANVTGSAASPTAFAMPTCSGVNSALRYTSGTGFTCASAIALTSSPISQFAATTSAQLAGVISDETGSGALVFATGAAVNPTSIGLATPGSGAFTTLSATGLISPASTVGVKGTVTNDSAQAGSIGEYPSPGITLGTSLTNGAPFNAASITLTAGDWDVSGTISFINGAGASSSVMNASLSTTTVTQNTTVGFMTSSPNTTTTAVTTRMSTPLARFALSVTTTIFLVGVDTFSGGTVTSDGMVRARRVR